MRKVADLLALLEGGGALLASLLLRLALLEEGLGNEDLVLGGNGTVKTEEWLSVWSQCIVKENIAELRTAAWSGILDRRHL